VTLPTGGQALGAGDWGAGLIVPLSFDLGGSVALALSPHIDAAVDEDRSGRHLAYGSVIGIDIDLSDRLSGTAEFSVSRDHDPGGHSTELLAGFALAWQSGENRQVDIGLNIGLDRDSPDSQLYLGFVQRF
jgi:hypothetical protein